MKITIDVTDAQGAELSDLQQYAEILADDRIARKAERIKSDALTTLLELPKAELDVIIDPIIAAKEAAKEAELEIKP